MSQYRCTICGYIYDEEAQGKKWEELPDSWVCPDCGVGKDMFEKVVAAKLPATPSFTAEVQEIIEETHDVKSLLLTKPATFTFIPGQYCFVAFGNNPLFLDKTKPFTFSSSPTENCIELTFKKVGEFTTALGDMAVGDSLIIQGPKDSKLELVETTKDIVLVAGGSGITPMMSILRYAAAKNLPNKFILFFGNKTVADIIYKNELEQIGKEHANIKVVNVIENDPSWNGEKGFIDKEKVLRYVANPKDSTWYLCGPPGMMKAVLGTLQSIGVPEENI